MTVMAITPDGDAEMTILRRMEMHMMVSTCDGKHGCDDLLSTAIAPMARIMITTAIAMLMTMLMVMVVMATIVMLRIPKMTISIMHDGMN